MEHRIHGQQSDEPGSEHRRSQVARSGYRLCQGIGKSGEGTDPGAGRDRDAGAGQSVAAVRAELAEVNPVADFALGLMSATYD